MKRIEDIFNAMQKLPEEVRKVFAMVSFIISAVFVFSFWTSSVSKNLANVSQSQITQNFAVAEETALPEKTVSPKEGVIDIIKSLGSFAPSSSPKELGSGVRQSIDSFIKKIDLLDVE